MKKYFEEITDKRQQWKVKYSLTEIIITTICAVISGCDYWEDITDFCKVKEEWFRERLGLKLTNEIASHDTYQRIFAMVDPKEFEKSFISWVESIKKPTVVFKEDYSRTRKDNSGENFAVVRRIALTALKNYEVKGMSLARKRHKCEYDCEFMADILLSIV